MRHNVANRRRQHLSHISGQDYVLYSTSFLEFVKNVTAVLACVEVCEFFCKPWLSTGFVVCFTE